MLIPRQKLQEQWKNRHRVMLEKTLKISEKELPEETAFHKNKEQSHIMQVVKTHPEMPEEMELSKDRRKQLSELMLEYATGTTKRRIRRKNSWRNRDITHVRNAKRASTTIMGKTRHLEQYPERKEEPQMGNLRTYVMTVAETSETQVS